MSMEISPQHHSIVLGKQNSNLKMIMQRTGTQIMFPDAGDPNIPSLKKSNVIITGAIHNVYLARQQLVVSLTNIHAYVSMSGLDVPQRSLQNFTRSEWQIRFLNAVRNRHWYIDRSLTGQVHRGSCRRGQFVCSKNNIECFSVPESPQWLNKNQSE